MPYFVVRRVCLAIAILSGVSASAAAEGTPCRVMTWNIRFDNPADGPNAWPHRRDAVAQFIADENVDVVGMQEALRTQIDDLAQRMPDYAWYGVGRDDGKELGEYSPVFYQRERFEREDQGTFWLSEEPEEPGRTDWGAACPRLVTWVRLKQRETGNRFVFYNTHFDHVSDEARRKGSLLIRQRMAEISDVAQILVGDLNSQPDSEPVKSLVAENKLQQAYDLAHKRSGATGTWTAFHAIVPDRRIDHIFVTRGIEVLEHQIPNPQVDGRFASDHLPVMADLRLP